MSNRKTKHVDRYRLLFDNVLNGVAYCRMIFEDGKPADFIYLDVNKAFGELTGLRNVIGKKVTEVIPGIRQSNPEMLEIYGRVAVSGKPEHFESHIASLKLWRNISVYCPKKGHVVVVFENTAERKLAEAALSESEGKYRILVDNANEAILVAQDGMLKFVNRRTMEMTGYSEQELMTKPFSEFIHPDDRAMVIENHTKRIRGEPVPLRYTFMMLDSAGIAKWVEIGSAVIVWKGKPATLNFITDITDRKQAEEQIRVQLEELSHITRVTTMGELASSLAHEINQPLAAILSNAQAALRFIDKAKPNLEEVREALNNAEEQIRMQLEELSHVSRVETSDERASPLAHEINQPLAAILSNARAALRFIDKTEPDLEEVQEALKDIINDDQLAGNVIKELRALMKKEEPHWELLDISRVIEEVLVLITSISIIRNVKIKRDLPADLPPVHGSRVQMQQVLINLINNGCEAMRETGPSESVLTIRAYTEDSKNIVVEVIDCGQGLSEGTLEKIFKPFFTTKPKGLGMGLAISRSIIEAHSGSLTARNNPGKGATFNFTLPATGMKS